MKKRLYFIIILIGIAVSYNLNAQGVLDKIKQKAKDKVSQRADDKVDKAMDKTLDDAESSTKGGKKDSKAKDNETSPTTSDNNTGSAGTIKSYAKYDFVPGDKIIFQDNFKDEKEGEFPSQLDAKNGQGQIAVYNGEHVYQTLSDGTTIVPRIKGMSYLPEQYTIEFDANLEGFGGDDLDIELAGVEGSIEIFADRAVWNSFNGDVPKDVYDSWYPTNAEDHWRHIAVAVNKSLMKAYIDQFRVLNVPNFTGKATSVSITHSCHNGSAYACPHMFIRNIRIAAGGIDMYKKVTEEGKIITHGILFDIDKASIKPESMGTINSIYELLKNNASLKFEIDGHTDNSGASDHNLTLSQQRAESVKTQLVKMGIDASRLTTKGYGDSKPLSENNTPEGRANNRRVEFVKSAA